MGENMGARRLSASDRFRWLAVASLFVMTARAEPAGKLEKAVAKLEGNLTHFVWLSGQSPAAQSLRGQVQDALDPARGLREAVLAGAGATARYAEVREAIRRAEREATALFGKDEKGHVRRGGVSPVLEHLRQDWRQVVFAWEDVQIALASGG